MLPSMSSSRVPWAACGCGRSTASAWQPCGSTGTIPRRSMNRLSAGLSDGPSLREPRDTIPAALEILYACTLYPPAVGGAQIHLHRLAQEIQALGHGVHVLTHAGRNRRDWLRLSTFASDPRRDYVHEGVPVSQLGFP